MPNSQINQLNAENSLKSKETMSDNVYYVNLVDGVLLFSQIGTFGYLHLKTNNSPKWAL